MSEYKLARFAPTPSGFLHIGNIYSFIITHHLANKYGAKVLLRIDDLDRERYKPRFVQDIFDTLNFLEIPYDQGPRDLSDFEQNHSQIHRLPLYQRALEDLKNKKVLFACDCSRKKIEKLNPKGYYSGFCLRRNLSFDQAEITWRIKAKMHIDVPFKELNLGIVNGKLPGIMTDFVVRKKDAMPSYQLTSLVDDLHFGVDLIVRGKDLWGSTIAQVYLSKFLSENNFAENTFHHHQLIHGSNNQKLSKSSDVSSIQLLRKTGKKKEDIYQIIAEAAGLKDRPKSLGEFGGLVI
ncbi:glutamate--tRNA ligase family protein [Aquiflexum sp. TKW24L]|uniref:glutamate--tRNA ligase family protein n=1 Tax=Aquiflexum sp. TKW24L TaxID=2942212 RepID=UPI0020C16050|nr:glutamate--tRNA ligase family protein [Aquiflexum sp. TKW24L]MCL6258753.1 glutamate--tRNA ligase family protein [Aquiflexum sp. TKW24L]